MTSFRYSLVLVATIGLTPFFQVEAATGPACIKNKNANASIFVSVRWPGGQTNFELRPLETHRLDNMNDADTVVCVDKKPPPPYSCPNQQKVPINNC